MSCKHGNWSPCDECDAEDAALDSAYKRGYEAGKCSKERHMKIIVPNYVNADDANRLYGESYGVNWEYEDSKKSPTAERIMELHDETMTALTAPAAEQGHSSICAHGNLPADRCARCAAFGAAPPEARGVEGMVPAIEPVQRGTARPWWVPGATVTVTVNASGVPEVAAQGWHFDGKGLTPSRTDFIAAVFAWIVENAADDRRVYDDTADDLPEAHGVEGMDYLQGHAGTIVGWWRDGDFLRAGADDNASAFMDKGWVPVAPVPPSTAYALPGAATPNPVRAEQPEVQGEDVEKFREQLIMLFYRHSQIGSEDDAALADKVIELLAPAAPGAAVGVDKAWPAIERVIVDAFNAGAHGDEFDMLAAKAKVTAALAGKEGAK